MTIAANNVIQDPLSVGNALKTVSMRIRGTRIDEDEDGDTVMEAGALRKLIYDATKVDIVDENNEFKSTYEILLEISKVWKDLDDMTRATLLEKIAGKHRGSTISALLNDTNTLVDAYKDALNSVGSAEEEFLKRTESVEFHLKQLNAAWQNLAKNSATVESVNSIIDGLIKIIDLVDRAGVLNVLGATLGGIIGLFTQFKMIPYFDAIGKEAEQNGESVKLFGKEVKDLDGKLGKMARNEKSMHSFAGAIKTVTTALAGFKKGALFLLAFYGITNVIEVLGIAYDKFANRIEYAQDKIDDLNSTIDKLKSEQKLLDLKLSSDGLTIAEKERLAIIEKEIKLREYDLKLEQNRWKKYQQKDYAPTVTTQSGEIVENNGTPADLTSAKVENQSRIYYESAQNIRLYYDEVARLSEAYESAQAAGEDTTYIQNQLSSVSQKLFEEQQKQKSSIATLQESYIELGEQQKILTQLTEWSVGAEKDAYQSKLNMVTADHELTGALLGIKKVSEDVGKDQLLQIDRYNALQEKISAVTTEQGISQESLDEMKKEYPEVASVIETYGQKSGEVWKIESSWMSALQTNANNAFDDIMAGQVQATLVSKTESDKRIEKLKEEIAWWMAVKDNWDDKNGPVGNIVSRFAEWRIDSLSGNLSEEENKAAEINESVQNIKDILAGLGTYQEDENGDGIPTNTGDGDLDKSVDIFDKYANALAKAREEIERYGAAVELTQAQLDLNQSQEERSVELLGEEQELYGKLLETQQARYKIVNDTLWLQQQQLKAVKEEASQKVSAKLGTDVDVSNWTQADVEEFVYNLKVDTSEADADLANFLNAMIEMQGDVDKLYVDWYNMKKEIRDTELEQLQKVIDFQNDSLEQFDDARKQTEKILSLLEEVEDTEDERLNIVKNLSDSYEGQKETIMAMHQANVAQMHELAKDMERNQQAYNRLVEQNQKLEEDYLDVIQAQLNYKQQQIDLERELAEKRAESEIYGDKGKDRWEDARQDEIDALNDQIDELNKKAEEDDFAEQMAEYEKDIAEKEQEIADLYKKLDNLRSQKTVQTLEQQADGSFQWKYVEDQIAINETLEEIADKEVEIEELKNEKKEAEEERALEEEIAHLESQIEAIEDEVERRQQLFDEELQVIEDTYQKEKTKLAQWLQDEITHWQTRVAENEIGLINYDAMNTAGWNMINTNTDTALTDLEGTYDLHFQNIVNIIGQHAATAIAHINAIAAAQRRAAEAAREAAAARASANSADGSHAMGLRFVEANNYVARLHYGERVLTRQEAQQYNAIEEDLKAGHLKAYFDSMKQETADRISTGISTSVARIDSSVPMAGNNSSTSFVIEHLELPNVQDTQDFANILQRWAKQEFGGLAQKAKIVKAR